MSSKISLWVGLIGVAATIPLVQTVAVAKSSVEINEIAKAVTVSISSSQSQGSGVIIQRKGDTYTVLTASYVVRDRASYKITTPDNRQYDAIINSIKYVPGDSNLAIVQFRSTINYQSAKLGNSNLIEAGMELYVAGFPANVSKIPAISVIKGKVIANSNKPFIQNYSLSYDNDTRVGMGGGAVLNSNGELVAIHAISDRNTDGVRTGFRLGTKIERFSAVASQMGVELIALNTPSFQTVAVAKSSVEINRIAKQVTVQITGCGFSSGVIVRKNGKTYTVLTVAHAVKKSGCKVTTPDDAKYQVTQIKTFPNNVDLAVFTFTSGKSYPVAKLIDNSDRVESGETVYVSGFPLSSGISNSIYAFVKGDVVSNSSTKQQGQGYSLIYSNNTLPGHSGGPVWNNKGEVIAIHGQGDVDTKIEKTMNDDVRVKTGFNLGITVNTFVKLATAAGIGGYAPVVVAANPKPVDDLVAHATFKYSKGEYRGMVADMDRAIAIDSKNARPYFLRGIAKYGLRDSPEALSDSNLVTQYTQAALADFNRAIQLDPNFAAAYNGRGNVKVKLNDTMGALANFNRAIQIDPNFAKTYYNRGVLKKNKLNDRAGAIKDMKQAAKMFQQQGNDRLYQMAIDKLREW